MDERVKKWLYDICFSIEEIEGYFQEEEKSFERFKQNILLKRAIERNLEIIGEAVNRILLRDPEIKIDNARRIVGLRFVAKVS